MCTKVKNGLTKHNLQLSLKSSLTIILCVDVYFFLYKLYQRVKFYSISSYFFFFSFSAAYRLAIVCETRNMIVGCKFVSTYSYSMEKKNLIPKQFYFKPTTSQMEYLIKKK